MDIPPSYRDDRASVTSLPTGPGAAAILAAGIGSLALGVLALASDAAPAVQHAMIFWRPSGALSGVTTCAIGIWLAAWFVLGHRWADRDVSLTGINIASGLMLVGGLLLTFPPFMDLLQGK